MRDGRDRRRSQRYPVTLSARIEDARRTYRAEILDVSLGGLLLSSPATFLAEAGAKLIVDAALLGTIRARVVPTTARGIHLRLDDRADHYGVAVRRLSRLSRAW